MKHPPDTPTQPVMGRLAIMGEIVTVESEDTTQKHPLALLITFDSVEDVRKAIGDGTCRFKFG
jgi:hypothetical protein